MSRAAPKYKPNGAFKLLTYVLYGQYSYMTRLPRGIIRLHSIRKIARLLGTQSFLINRHIIWLESQGYLESVSYSTNKRQVQFRVRKPTYVETQQS